jgi:hypothetical protein
MVPDIEIVVSLLPEMFGLANQSPQHVLLQRFDRVGKCSAWRFAHKQMNVFRHHDISIDLQTEATPNAPQRQFKQAFAFDGRKQQTAPVATKCDEVGLSRLLIPLQS